MTGRELGVATPIGIMWLEDDVLVHEVDSLDVITAEQARGVVETVNELTGGRPVVAVVDIRAVGYALPEARNAFAGSLEDAGEVATALVVSNQASRAMAQIFLAMSRPARPVKVFTNLDSAMEWARAQSDDIS